MIKIHLDNKTFQFDSRYIKAKLVSGQALPILYSIFFVLLIGSFIPKISDQISSGDDEFQFMAYFILAFWGFMIAIFVLSILTAIRFANLDSNFQFTIDPTKKLVIDKMILTNLNYKKQEHRFLRGWHQSYYEIKFETSNSQGKFILEDDEFIRFKEVIDKNTKTAFI